MDTSKRIDNTVKIIGDILEKHKDKEELKEAYERIERLKRKRNVEQGGKMANNNQLIEKPKLNFFQRIRKAMLMFNIDAMKYRKAPDYLRYDDDVIEALVTKRPIDFAEVGFSKKVETVEKIPGLFEKLAEDQKVAIVEQKEEFASRMQEFELENLIFGKGQDKYIKYIPVNLQVN